MRSLLVAAAVLAACAKSHAPVETYRYTPAHPSPKYAPSASTAQAPNDFRYRIHPATDPFFDSFDTHPDVPAVRTSGSEPKVTDEARRANVHGVVLLEVGIDETGRPAGFIVLKPLPLGLTEAAIDAVRTWRFKPAMRNGKPVRSLQNIEVRFP